MLTLEEDFEPVRTFVLIEVAVEPLVKIIVDKVEVAEVYMTEGQEMNISCIAEEAYPRPVFRWIISDGFALQEKQVAKTLLNTSFIIVTDCQHHRVEFISRMY